MIQTGPVAAEIVLVGGGHAHLHVLAEFARRPEPGIRLTLVARELETPYSGMLPGHIAGIYSREDVHVDLARLCAATGARLIHATACGIDRMQRRLLLEGRPSIAYDFLSIDVGIVPRLDSIEGAAEHAVPVKPIGLFLDRLDRLLDSCRQENAPRRIAVIGGGAGGVELLLSLRTRLRAEAARAGLDPDRFEFHCVTTSPLLAGHHERVQQVFRRQFAGKGILLHEGKAAAAVTQGAIRLADGTEVAADTVLIATDAAPPGWFASTGLALDEGGFLAVGSGLQSINDPSIFAAGDCAGMVENPRPKAGVYAVRAGPPLARNLRLAAQGRKPAPWVPQKQNLAIISTGERYAIASRGSFKAEGAWVWRLKNWIDRRWMRMYQDVPAMLRRMHRAAAPPPLPSPEEMRCGGCAAKIGPGPLSAALARLPPAPDSQVLLGIDHPDDAAVVAAPSPGRVLLHSVDFFRAFVDDPYLLGEIAANHALNDIFAMGGTPRHALALAMVPHGAPHIVEEDLFQLLAGARNCLDREEVALAGGHSSEGAELAIGFAVTGEIPPAQILRKSGLRPGDALILTRPIGSAILFAGLMRGLTPAHAVTTALAQMRQSNRKAARLLIGAGASAMTDITGFGLAGHLGEMLAASKVSASLTLSRLPLYPQAEPLARQGIRSSLLDENLALRRLLRDDAEPWQLALLFDPQTSGGLLAGVPAEKAEAVLATLHAQGYSHAARIGEITGQSESARAIGIELA